MGGVVCIALGDGGWERERGRMRAFFGEWVAGGVWDVGFIGGSYGGFGGRRLLYFCCSC